MRPSRGNFFEIWGGVSAALLLFLTFGALAAVVSRADSVVRLSAADFAALRFTVVQALLSAGLSVALAIPVARALARRQFFGRGALIALLGAPFILPVIVAVLGLLAVFGRAGLFNKMLNWAGLETVSIYGLGGVVLAHVFFNLPLATRLLLQSWQTIPAERFRLAQSLGFKDRDVRRHIEWPMLREVSPGIFAVIFLICMTSFAVALTLGGGPRATTVELAIYQALRFDFDPGKAAMLAFVQFGLCLLAAVFAWRLAALQGFGAGLDRDVFRRDGASVLARLTDGFWIVFAVLLLVLPLGMLVWRGGGALPGLPVSVWWAAVRSLGVALCSAFLMLMIAWPLVVLSINKRRGAWIESLGYLTVSASPLVIGTGLFIISHRFFSPQSLALPITVLVNASLSLPFAMRALLPGLRGVETNYGRLADGLGLRGFDRFRLLWLPRLRRPIGFALGLSAALSLGDLGVIALFSDPDAGTLPLMIYRLMGAYRMQDASGAAVLLLALSFGIFLLFDQSHRWGAARDAEN